MGLKNNGLIAPAWVKCEDRNGYTAFLHQGHYRRTTLTLYSLPRLCGPMKGIAGEDGQNTCYHDFNDYAQKIW
jgi:hypothetical protein